MALYCGIRASLRIRSISCRHRSWHTSRIISIVRRKICGVSCWLPHDGLICDNHCCSWLDLVRELLGKLGVEMNSGSQLLGLDRPTFAGHTHPSACLASRRELTRFAGAAFE